MVVGDAGTKRNSATLEDRARWAMHLALAVHRCKKMINDVVEASGAHAHFQENPLQRAKRDVDTLSCHYLFDLDGKLETYGKPLLGQELEGQPMV